MTTAIRRRRGTTAQHSTFIGLEGETTIDTDKEVVVVHDGTTQGGFPLMRENGSNSALALGSAGTPSLKFTGDTNTGIYSPGADQVAISTNGTGRLFVNASGNVGVGTTSPSFLLTCATSADGVDGVSVESPSLNGVIRLRADGTNGNAIRVGGVGAQGNTLRFLVGSDVERMRIDSSGRLGLGSTLAGNANNRLLVRSDSASAISNVLLLNNGPADNNAGQGVRINLSGVSEANSNIRYAYIEAANQTSSNDHYLAFGTNSAAATPTERLRITSAGNVGIGTSSPGNKLAVIGTTGALADASIRINGTAGTQSANSGLWITGNQTTSHHNWLIGSQYNVNNGFEITPSTAVDGATFSTPALVVTSAGRVGIGTTSPGKTLEVSTASSTDGIALSRAGSNRVLLTADGIVAWGATANQGTLTWDANQAIIKAAASNSLLFAANNSAEHARIDTSGRLLVGTSTARTNFDNGGVSARMQVEGLNAGNCYISAVGVGSNNYDAGGLVLARSAGTTVGGNSLVANGDFVGLIRFMGNDGSDFVEAARIDALVDGTPGANDMPGRLVFSTTADGASSPTERMRLDSSGRLLVGTSTPVGPAQVVSQSGFGSIAVSVTLNGTSTVTVPAGCICTIASGGFPGDSAIFSLKSTGGSQGCYLMAQGTAGNIGFGTTSNPSTGSRLNIWISANNTMSIQDVGAGNRTIYLTFMSVGV